MRIEGLYVPLVTPFGEDGAVDLDALERLARDVIAGGADGVVALGSTGEPLSLSAAESAAVVDVCAGACVEADALLIVGAGTVDTRATIERHEALADLPGKVAALTVVPYYVRPCEASVVRHFEAVAERSPAPVLVYNVPPRTGVGLGADALLELAAIDGIAGMKQSAGAVDTDTVRVLAEAPDDFAVLCGDDAFILPLLALCAVGAIAASAHFETARFARLIRDQSPADAAALLPLVLALFAEPNPAVIKALLHREGRIATPDVRMPLGNASPAALDAVMAVA
ncbi:MAG: 4-hydroxy-tetrahydrodipicolinate synthase [Solirubrobacteraceae bacterium]|jgi:4-hydroxy-tetrahydrodipicolinate synthase|nr:4-hydroxy-tetrahydrodipicolinate synthase [Solirubrobacteraceae bacterium]